MPTTSETETLVVPAGLPGQRELRITRESVATLSRPDIERALRYVSGASLEHGTKPQLASRETLVLLWRRIDDIVRQQADTRGTFYKARQPGDVIDPNPEHRCAVCGKSTAFGSGTHLGPETWYCSPTIGRSRQKG